MTYCVGILLREGLIMISDTRTNAGIDNISVYRKMHVLADAGAEAHAEADAGGRLILCMSAGNLSVTQSVLDMLAEGLPPLGPEERPRTVADMPTMFRVAQLVGEAVTIAGRALKPGLLAAGVDAGISLLVGGRIGGGPLKLYLVYDAGNFIECGADSPFLQIGATQYGKPILDRAMDFDTSLDEAVKVGLLSFDSTIRSNLGVGLPLDVVVIPADRARDTIRRRIAEDDAYFRDLSLRWSLLLNESRATIPDPPFMAREGAFSALGTR